MLAHADNSIFKMSRCENGIFLTQKNEWGEHPMKISTADERGLTLINFPPQFLRHDPLWKN